MNDQLHLATFAIDSVTVPPGRALFFWNGEWCEWDDALEALSVTMPMQADPDAKQMVFIPRVRLVNE